MLVILTAVAVSPSLAGAPAIAAMSDEVPAGAEVIEMNGGDVITLDEPRILRPRGILTTAWSTLDVEALAGLPSTGLGAVVLETTVSTASEQGHVYARPLGSSDAGTIVASYTVAGTRMLTVVATGRGGQLQVRSAAGSPRVSMRVVAWLPEQSHVVVPVESTKPRQVTATKHGTVVPVVGDGMGSEGATAVLASLTVNANLAGGLAAWTTGSIAPTTHERYPTGTSTIFQIVRPDEAGNVTISTSEGRAKVAIQVLGSASSLSTLMARGAPGRLAVLRPSKGSRTVTKRVQTAGVQGVPESATASWITVAASKGAVVEVWPQTAVRGEPLHAWRATGTAVSLRLPATNSGQYTFRSSRTARMTSVNVHGWEGGANGPQKLSMQLREGTQLVGDPDTLAFDGDTLLLGPTADDVVVGGQLVATVDSLPYTLNVLDVAPADAGGQSVSVTPAALDDAFADIDVTVGSPLSPDAESEDSGVLRSGRSARRNHKAVPLRRGIDPSLGSTFNVPFKVGTPSCTVNTPQPVLTFGFDGSQHFDFDKSGGIVDLSLKGRVTSNLTMASGGSVACSWEAPALATIPVAGPFVLKLKPTVSMSLDAPSDGHSGLDLTNTANAYASVYYNGETVAGNALNFDGSSKSLLGGGTAKLDIGVKASFGLPEFGEFDIGPEVAITIGGSLQLGPPDPADDVHQRRLAGPHCFDMTAGPFIQFGAAMLMPFWDVHLDIARFDPGRQVLHRGPCVGYVGTITSTWAGSYEKGGNGCTAQSCAGLTWSHVLTQTLKPGLADFDPSYNIVVQQYDWTWQGHEVREDDVPTTYDGSHSTPCTWTTTSEGSGAVTWEDLRAVSDGWYAKVWQGWSEDSGNYYATDYLAARGESTTEVVGEPGWCGTDYTSEDAVPPFLYANGESGALDLSRPTINTTLTYWPPYHPERAWTIVFDLERKEYSRADGFDF